MLTIHVLPKWLKAFLLAHPLYKSPPSLAPTRKRREDIRLDNAGKFHLKFTVADSVVPNVNSLGAMPVIQMISLCSTAADNPSQVSARRTAYHAT